MAPLQFLREFASLSRMHQQIFLHLAATSRQIILAHDHDAIHAAARQLCCHPRTIRRALRAISARPRLAQVIRMVKITRAAYREMQAAHADAMAPDDDQETTDDE